MSVKQNALNMLMEQHFVNRTTDKLMLREVWLLTFGLVPSKSIGVIRYMSMKGCLWVMVMIWPENNPPPPTQNTLLFSLNPQNTGNVWL